MKNNFKKIFESDLDKCYKPNVSIQDFDLENDYNYNSDFKSRMLRKVVRIVMPTIMLVAVIFLSINLVILSNKLKHPYTECIKKDYVNNYCEEIIEDPILIININDIEAYVFVGYNRDSNDEIEEWVYFLSLEKLKYNNHIKVFVNSDEFDINEGFDLLKIYDSSHHRLELKIIVNNETHTYIIEK